jgi:hypothetical protein
LHPASLPRHFTASICKVEFCKRVVLHGVLELEREDAVQIVSRKRNKCAPSLCRRDLKATFS